MFGFLLKLVILFVCNALVLWAIDVYLFPESFQITEGIHGYMYTGTIFSLFNIIVKPILHVLSLPLKVITLGLSSLAVNGLLLYFLQMFVQTITELDTTVFVDGIFMYVLVGSIMAFANAFFHAIGLD